MFQFVQLFCAVLEMMILMNVLGNQLPDFTVTNSSHSNPHQERNRKNSFNYFLRKHIKIEPLTNKLRSPKWTEGKWDEYLEDRSHLIFLANHIDIPSTATKIYIDFGLSTYESSLKYMKENYPIEFDKIYGFEVNQDSFVIPEKERPYYEKKFQFFNTFVSDHDDNQQNTIDAIRFIKEVVKPGDFCVLKMDIEGGEWNLLPKIEKAGLFSLISELFVELHFKHPSYHFDNRLNWDIYKDHTKEEAIALLQRYREIGLYAHYWP